MDNKAGPSGSKSTSSSRKKRRQSDDYESDYSDEDVYSQRADEDSSSSEDSSSCGSDDSIFDTRLKQKTTSRVPPAQPSRSSAPKTTSHIPLAQPSRSPASKTVSCVPPPQPSSSSASKRGLCESDGRAIIQCKRLRPSFRDGPTRNNSTQSLKLPDLNSSSASKSAPRLLEFDGDGSFEFNSEIDCRPTSPNIVQDYGDFLPDIPINPTSSTPSVSLLRSDAITPNLSPERDDVSPSIMAVRRSGSRTPDLPDDFYLSPNNSPSGQGATTTWSSDPSSMKSLEFTKEQELLVPPPTDPYEAFRLMIDDELLDLIVRETNANAIRVGNAQNVKQNSRIKSWKDLTKEELLTFLGLLLHTGTIRLNRLSDYWKRHYLFNIPCFGQFMSRNRFLLILRCLHFTSVTSEEDRLNKIRPFMDHFNNKMKTIYCPGKELSLDESMVLWRGRLLFRQYIKNKRHKYGIKLYVLAEPDGTVLKFQVYAGANDETSGQGHSSKIVFKLLEERLDCGHHVYMDNYYNSYGLAVKLLDRQTYCTGTLRKNRKDNPVEIGSVSLEKGENKSLFLNGVHVGKWRDKRYVLYISTEHGSEMMETTSKRGSIVVKPMAIVHYNNFMSGVDLQDQMLAYYPVQRKTLRWYKKLFVHMLQMSLTNALHLYNTFSANDKLNLYDFRMKILEKLLPDPNDVNRRNVLKVKHELTKIEKTRTRVKTVGRVTKQTIEVVRKECKGCKSQKKNVQTIYECKQCEGSPGFCTKCFCLAHS
ncbi:piggyBac transposable element-derived protein 4-like [Bicyclus anynana]|uniref:PiggyBac transposable element-derived protein 4-like n=1 Tax=Bicyclus anynana TaxID=110368 RepID=A0ABM3LHC9_BICAN|nr:piggyBac transposable element-derived protein 4-like [Bicyclus anynana]